MFLTFSRIFRIFKRHYMPNKHASEKDLRKSAKRRVHNERIKSYLRHLTNESNKALAGNLNTAKDLVKKLQQALDKAAKVGVIDPNKASRAKAKFMKRTGKQ